jgi:HPt (histidine-containing phosphotransfer) domain-containing protein
MRIEHVLVAALGVALLFAAVSPLIPSGAYSQWHNVLYTAAAVWILATVLYRIARREPVWRANILGAVMMLVIMAVYLAYVNIYAKPASVQIEKDLETLEEARQTFEKYFAQTAAHTSVAVSSVITAAVILAPFTLGLSVAVLLALIDLAIDVVNEFMSMVASYLGLAYAVVSVLAPLVRAVEIFPAIFAPAAAAAVPNKRTIAVAAYVAAVPLLLSVAVATAPGLAPMSGLLPIEEEGYVQPGAVRIETNAPIVVEFKAPYVYYNGTHWVNSSQWWWYTVPPPGGNVTLTNGTWTLTRYIYMWVEYPVGITFTLQNGTFAWGTVNFTSVNATYFYPLPNRTFVIYVPYKWRDDWSAAASLKPDSIGIAGGGKMNATWVFKYECYGTVSQCPGTRWDLDGLAAEYRDLVVKVLGTEYADVSYSKSAVTAAMGESDWKKICNATESAVLSAFGARCSGWHPTKRWSTTIDVSSQPKIECRTVGNETRCEEVETWHRATVAVSLLYVPAPTPAVAGFQRGKHSTRDVVDTIFGYAFYALSSIFLPGRGFALLAAKFVEPFAWIWTSLIPWALRLVYTLIAVTAGAAGVLIIVGAGAPVLKILGLSQFFQLKLRASSVETTVLQLASRGLAAAGRGGAAVAGGATAAATAEAVKNVTASWIRYAQMWALYASSALRWTVWLWRFDPIRLLAALGLSGYVGSKIDLKIFITAPHPRLQPAANALAKLLEYSVRQLKGMHLLMHHGAPLTPELEAAQKSAKALDWLWAATHLRVDFFVAKAVARTFHAAYHLSGGDAKLAALWTVLMRTPPRHVGDLAAFIVEFNLKVKPFSVHPADLAEGFKRLNLLYTQEQAAARYLAHYGYDYLRLKQAWEAYKDWFTRNTDILRPELFTYLPADSFARNVIANFAVERLREGDPRALYFSPIPEFRRLAAEQLGIKITPEGDVKPMWNMWLKGAAKAAERGDVEAALRLAPGPMGQKLQLYEPLQIDSSGTDRLRDVMERIVEKAARAAGVDRDAAAAGVWKMLEDPQMRKTLKLEGDYKRLEDALRQAVSDILPRNIVEAALPNVMQGETLKALYELLKEDKPEWFERLPEHVQAQVLGKLPYGDWSYAYSAKYAAEVADITWREITPHGQVVEHRVLDYLPAPVRDAVAAQRLAALDAPPLQQQQQPAPPAPAVDYSQYAKAMQMFRVEGYEVLEGGQTAYRQIKPEDLAAFGTPAEVRKMLAEAAMFANASEKYYDEGRDYIPLRIEGKDEEERAKKLREFLERQLHEIKDAASAAGLSEAEADAAAERWLKMLTSSEYADFRDKLLELALYEDGPDAYMALLSMIEAAAKYVSAGGAEAAQRLEEAARSAPERFTPAGERYAPAEDRYEPVGETEERVEAEVGKIKDEDHAEAVRRILGIDVTKAEDESVAYEISRTYGLPHDVAARLAEDFGEYAKEVAKEVKRVDDWLAKAGADDEFRRRYIEQNLGRIVEDADGVIRELAEEAAKKAPKELQDLVADDLAKGKFDEVNWKLSQIERYCESKGGCTPEERRDLYGKL